MSDERNWFDGEEEQDEQEALTPNVKEEPCPSVQTQTAEEREERRAAAEAKAKKKGPISKTGQGRFNR
jgi:hypothetical protein